MLYWGSSQVVTPTDVLCILPPREDAIKVLSSLGSHSSFHMPMGLNQPSVEPFVILPPILLSPCSQVLHGLSTPTLLDFSLIIFPLVFRCSEN